jgi:hypothetical protein
MRCFDPVWRLNLIAKLREKHTPEEIYSDSLRKAVYTRVFSGLKCLRIRSSHKLFRIQSFRTRHVRNREDLLSDSSLRV